MINFQTIHSRVLPDQHDVGIVHIGLGAFHRAHQGVYLEKVLSEQGGDWSIVSANIRSNYRLVDQLNAAGHRYHVVEYSDKETAKVREIRAIKEAIFTGTEDGRKALLKYLTASTTKIVTLTVTEKGYYLEPVSGRLLIDNPDIRHDLNPVNQPKTALGFIVQALKQRKDQGIEAFTVLSCDNMPHNGVRAKQAAVEFAKVKDEAFAKWIEKNVAFPSTMVDRIVPAVSPADIEMIYADTGLNEPILVKTEHFSQWVIEDDFPLGRPDWETAGVQMVDDVANYEMMKLRMLNGSHSLLAYLGSLAGFKTVSEAMQDESIRAFLDFYMRQEVAPTLSSFSSEELEAYSEQLLQRFENTSLHHQLLQIAMDGSQKLPQRWLSTLLQLRDLKLPSTAIELGIAGWMSFVCHAAYGSQSINDPLESELFELSQNHRESSHDLVQSFLKRDDIFPSSLKENTALITRLADLINQIHSGTKIQQMMLSVIQNTRVER